MVASICNRLNPLKFDICVVYSTTKATRPQEFENLFTDNVRKIYIPQMVRSINPKKDIDAFVTLLKLFKKEKPDIIHAHSSKAGFLARFSAFLCKVPKIFYSSHCYGFRMTNVSLPLRVFYFLLEALASPAGQTIVNAPNELKIAKIISLGRAMPCYNGVDTSKLKPGYYQKKLPYKTIASCGRITYPKNPYAFLRLCHRLNEKYKNLRFVWIGSGSENEQKSFFEKIEDSKLKNISVTGWLGREDTIKKLSEADILIHYSRWDVMPTAVSEAMALGKPVIGSKAVDQIKHGKNGFIAHCEKDLLQYTSKLIEDDKLITEMGKNARRTVTENYDIKEMVRKLENIYLTHRK